MKDELAKLLWLGSEAESYDLYPLIGQLASQRACSQNRSIQRQLLVSYAKLGAVACHLVGNRIALNSQEFQKLVSPARRT